MITYILRVKGESDINETMGTSKPESCTSWGLVKKRRTLARAHLEHDHIQTVVKARTGSSTITTCWRKANVWRTLARWLAHSIWTKAWQRWGFSETMVQSWSWTTAKQNQLLDLVIFANCAACSRSPVYFLLVSEPMVFDLLQLLSHTLLLPMPSSMSLVISPSLSLLEMMTIMGSEIYYNSLIR
jgi:hypothetical protein